MKNNNLNTTNTAALLFKHDADIAKSSRLYNQAMKRFFVEDFATNSNFKQSLVMLNGFMQLAIDAAIKTTTIKTAADDTNYHSDLAKACTVLTATRKRLINNVQNHINAIDILEGEKYSLKQVRHTSKHDKQANYMWNGTLNLVKIEAGKRTATATATAKVATTKPTEASNATVAEVFAGKSKNQQIAALKQLAKHGDIKVSAQAVLDILFGLNVFVALDTAAEKAA